MRIAFITAGAAGMYCGSCSRDNALAVELLARGHDVTLLPLYTPTNPDETNVSRDRVLFGGISIYLQQSLAFFDRYRKAGNFNRPWLLAVSYSGAALDLTWTAAGRYDAYFERSVKPWDIVAGALICERAGLRVLELPVHENLPWGILVAPPGLAEQLLELVAGP